jgi:hypothetical protein
VCLKWLMYPFRDLMSLLFQGSTALHLAAMKGHLHVVEFLLERAPQLVEMRDEVSLVWYVYGCPL